MSLVAELKRRNVFRVGLAYAVVAWFLIQAADIMLENFGAPGWVFKTVAGLLVLGFPVALFLSWAYELTPDGVKKAEDVPVDASITPRTGRRIDRLIVVALLGVIAILVAERVWFAASTPSDEIAAVSAPESGTAASIAVLAFQNMSADPENAYFADGISEEILNLLAGVQDLSVASRTSAFAFKGKDTPLPDIAEALSVRYVLEGSVRKAGNQVRVTAQLIDAERDRHLWSDTYDRTLDDIFAIQDEIAGAIGDALQIELLGRSGETVQAEAVDPEVYARFLEARHLLRSRDPEAMRRANEILIDVVQQEPEFARAHVVLGEAYLLNRNLALAHPLVPDSVAVSQAGLHAGIASSLNPELGGIDLILGSIADDRDRDVVTALDHYTRAIQLEPNEPRPYHWRGMLFCRWGYLERGLADLERGRTLEPENPNLLFAAADCLLSAGRIEESRALVRSGAELRGLSTHELIAIAALHSDDRAAAIAEYELMIEESAAPEEIAARIELLESPEEVVDLTELRMRLGREEVDIDLLLELRKYDALLEFLLDDEALPTAIAGLWSARHAAFRQDPRFIQLAEMLGGVDLWRSLGPPADCRAEGDSFTCGHDSTPPGSDA